MSGWMFSVIPQNLLRTVLFSKQDSATIQVILEDGDYATTAATFVPQQDIYKGDRMVDNGFFLLDKDDEDAEEYDWDDEPYVEDFWNWDID